MTTYDDTDLFSDSFTDFREVAETRRHSPLVTVLALAGAALLVIGGLVGVRLVQGSSGAGAVDPAGLLPVLGTAQVTSDVIAPADLEDLTIYPESTRLLLTDATASYYAALAPSNQVCIVAIPVGDLARAACTSQAHPSAVKVDDVMVVPTGARVPAGWHATSANVYAHE